MVCLSSTFRWRQWCRDILRNLCSKRWSDVKVASGTWENNAKEKTVNFEAIETDKIEFKVLEGVRGFGSAAEIQLLKPLSDSKPEEPVTPEKTCHS